MKFSAIFIIAVFLVHDASAISPISGGGSSSTSIATTADVLKGDNAGGALAFGSSTVGSNILSLTNPGAITFLKIAADNSVSARSAANFRSDISAAATGVNTDIISIALTGHSTNSFTSLVSDPALYLTGSWLTGGSGTTNFPHLFLQATGTTASTTWSTSGTAIGVNAVTGFTGNLIDSQLAGASKFKVASTGAATFAATVTANDFSVAALHGLAVGARGFIGDGGSDGLIKFTNNGLTGLTRLQLGGTTNNFASIGFDSVNGITLQSAAGTTTWNDASTANSGTVANRYLFGISAPTLTSTGNIVTDTVASTVYIGGAPTASTNTTIGTPYALNVATDPSKFGGPVIMKGYTVATLPSTAATGKVQGSRCFVTDALAPSFLVTVVGGGSVVTPVFYDGTNWVAE